MKIKPYRNKWKSEMIDRERFNNQMHYKSVERCLNMEFGYWNENFTQWDIFIANNITNNSEADIFFAFDKIAGVNGNVWMCPGFPEEVVEEKETTNIICNADGLLAEVPKQGGGGTISHYIKSSIVTLDDWKRVKEERFRIDHPDCKVDVEALKKLHPPTRDYPLGVYAGSMIGRIRDVLTFEGLAYAMFDYPDMLEDMVETCCQLMEHFLDQVLGERDFDYASGWEDICFKSGPIVTVDFFRDIVIPRYKRISKKLRTNGIDIWYTDCDVRPILPYLLEGGI